MISVPETDSYFEGVPFELKVVMLVATSAFSLICWNVELLMIGLVLSLLPLLTIGAKGSSLNAFKLYFWLAFSFVASQAVFYWGYYSGAQVSVLLYIFRPGANSFIDVLTMDRGIAVTVQGIYWGIESSLKFGITYFSALGVIYTTSPAEILRTIYGIKLPQFIRLSAISAFRVLPVMVEDMESIIAVAKVRRPDGLMKRLIEPFTVVKSMIFNSVKRAYHLSMAIEIKGMPELDIQRNKVNNLMTAIVLILTAVFILLIIISLFGSFSLQF